MFGLSGKSLRRDPGDIEGVKSGIVLKIKGSMGFKGTA